MRKLFTLIFATIIITGCGKGSSSAPPVAPLPVPGKALLLFPAEDEVCNQGTVVSATQNKVVFKWTAGTNADSYEVSAKNLLTATTVTQTSSSTQLEFTLLRNTPYSWTVMAKTAKNSGVVTQSDTWKFYNSRPGVTSYAPFPAEAVSPQFGQAINVDVNNYVTLQWKTSDVDNDIKDYDLYLGTSATPAVYAANITTTTLSTVSVKKGNTYYWKIVTRDAKGNTSTSAVFQFKTNL